MSSALEQRLEWANKWDCDVLLKELHDVYVNMEIMERQRGVTETSITAIKRTISDIQTITALSIEGRNAEERKARLAESLKDDTGYQALLKRLDIEQDSVTTLDIKIDAAGRHVRYLEYHIKYNLAMIGVLGCNE